MSAVLLLFAGCAKEERSRATDDEDLRKMLAALVKGIDERNPSMISRLAIEGFDAQGLIDTVWADREAQQVNHIIRRLRISEEAARAALEIRFIRDNKIFYRQSLAVGMAYAVDKWRLTEFRLFGP